MALPADPPTDSPDSRAATGDHRPPLQARSRRTLRRLTEAALEIVEQDGVAALTVQGVVERAGSSVGSFYARFDGKDALLRYLEGRVWREAEGKWEEAHASSGWADLPVEDAVRGVVALLVRTAERDARRRAAFGAADLPPPTDGGAEEGGEAAFHRRVLSDLSGLLASAAPSGGRAAPDPVELGYWMVVGTLRLLHGPGSPVTEAPPEERLAEELSKAYLALLGRGAGPRSEPEVDFFDVWG